MVGLQEIREHKFRSFLTMLGVILGVASLLAMFALTAGMAASWRAFITQIGGLERVTVADKAPSLELADMATLSPGRTLADAEALAAATSLITHVSPEMSAAATLSAPEGKTIGARIFGVWPDNFEINQHVLRQGRFISRLDLERGSRVVVLGDSIVSELWPGESGQDTEFIGRNITVNGRSFAVAGILERYETEEDKRTREVASSSEKRPALVRGPGFRRDPFRWKNSAVLIPLTTLYHEFQSGQTNMPPLSMAKLEQLHFRVRDLSLFQETVDTANNILRQTRRGIDDYQLETREEMMEGMQKSLRTTQLSGGLIASISLLVGGIGIANIMLASIAQRVRELGVRLAVGARRRDVFLQILAESTVIGVVGGFLGLGAGVLLLEILEAVAPSGSPPVVEPSAVMISVGFATAVGILSGLYPAWRASRLDPISALRYE